MMKKILTLLILLFAGMAFMNAQDDSNQLKKRYKKYYTDTKKKSDLEQEMSVDSDDEFTWNEAKGPEDFGYSPINRRDTLNSEALFKEELIEYDLRQQIKGVLHHPKTSRKKKNTTQQAWERRLTKNL